MANSELFEKGLAQLKAGNYVDARKLFVENEEKAGTTAKTKEQLAQAEVKLAAGDLQAAAALFEGVLDRNPGLPEAYLGLARISLFTNQVDAAKTHAQAAVKLAPGIPLAWTLMGLVLEAKGELANALTHLSKGAELGQTSFLCQFNYGRLLTSEKRAGEGIAYLLKATELDPKSPDAWAILGFAQKALKQWEKAIKAFEKAKDLQPKFPDGYATLADVLAEAREFKAARAILDQGLKNCGDHPALLEKAIACAMMESDAEGALAYCEREVKVAPNHEQGWLNLANLAMLAKEFDKGEAAAKELIKRNPKNWEAHYVLGNLYDAVPKEAEAEAAYKKAVALNPPDWRPFGNYGNLLVQSEDKARYGEAKTLLEKAVSLAPSGELRPHYNLALALVRLGDTQGALALAKKVQTEARPDDAIVAEAKKLESNLKEKSER